MVYVVVPGTQPLVPVTFVEFGGESDAGAPGRPAGYPIPAEAKTQAKWMAQAYAIARKNPRIDMMLWFMIRDEPNLGGWQSGLETVGNKRKPSWGVFRSLPRG